MHKRPFQCIKLNVSLQNLSFFNLNTQNLCSNWENRSWHQSSRYKKDRNNYMKCVRYESFSLCYHLALISRHSSRGQSMSIIHSVAAIQAPSSSETPSLAPKLTHSLLGSRCTVNSLDEKWRWDYGICVRLCASTWVPAQLCLEYMV